MIGTIYTLRASTNPDNLIAQINQTQLNDLSHIPAIKHGRKYKLAAKLHYETTYKVDIIERGFMLHPKHPWLGASTDGFILQPPTVVEFKCPLANSNIQTIQHLARTRKSWFLATDGSNVWLRPKHKYHHQCQIQMECLGVKSCLFIVYLCYEDGDFKDMFVEKIRKDDKLVAELVHKAHKFSTFKFNNAL